jgi:hypothetical protein
VINLNDYKGKGRKALRKLSDEEKLEIVDAIIDRDAELWKARAREHCDFDYYFRFVDGGIALTERTR